MYQMDVNKSDRSPHIFTSGLDLIKPKELLKVAPCNRHSHVKNVAVFFHSSAFVEIDDDDDDDDQGLSLTHYTLFWRVRSPQMTLVSDCDQSKCFETEKEIKRMQLKPFLMQIVGRWAKIFYISFAVGRNLVKFDRGSNI